MTDISSSNIENFQQINGTLVRKLEIGGNDWSDYVLSWPNIIRNEDQVSPGNTSISLSAVGGGLNSFINAPVSLVTSAALYIGADVNSLDIIYEGLISGMSVKGGIGTINIKNKLSKLTSRTMGTEDAPITFTDSSLPSDLFWAICVSYGGLSAVESTSNPDIDFAAYQEWAEVFSSDSIFMNASFSDIKCMEALRKLARYTDSTIVADFTKIVPRRFSLGQIPVDSISDTDMNNFSTSIEEDRIINEFITYGAYDVTSRIYSAAVLSVNSESRDLYGTRHVVEKDNSMWYVNSVSCLNLSDRRLNRQAEAYNLIGYKTGLNQIARHIGETVLIEDAQLGILEIPIRIKKIGLDMDKGVMAFNGDSSLLQTAFRLDYSLLDSSDVLS